MTYGQMVVAENASIRGFLERHRARLSGRVLDFGCGRCPYRGLVAEAGGDWRGFDPRADVAGADAGDWRHWGAFDAVLCTQVVQFIHDVPRLLAELHEVALGGAGALVMTYPTNWPVINGDDYCRYTENGMNRLLDAAGFYVVESESRGGWAADGYDLPFGYGVVAEAA